MEFVSVNIVLRSHGWFLTGREPGKILLLSAFTQMAGFEAEPQCMGSQAEPGNQKK
ncbi:Uncharacterized protein dnm_033240 [Desulfonema magnum]|uniref:Uncharacterized protein n=1 Tax=Desulfonema magnum TaxID=45655 RepID=A0A975BLI7_9BACT|nr:Uncharacterized protein dnm_033240 [Desulfonema magnum]